MSEKITAATLGGLRSFPPDYWLRYIERIIPAIINTSDEDEIFSRVKYHAEQVREIYWEDRIRRGLEMADEWDLAQKRRPQP